MRARERQAFLQEIEESLELARLAAEEQAEQERQVNELRSIATQILSYFHLEQHAETFLASGDGLALLANCCNCAAKWHNDALYEHKPILINLATSSGIECWQASGIVYIETSVGQVSFHVLYGEDEGLPEADGRVWSELEMQFNAELAAKAWLNGWSRCALNQIILLQQESTEEEMAA